MNDTEVAKRLSKLSDEEQELFSIRHSLAHILAAAVLDLYPETKLGFGPPVENGFYYDFQFSQNLSRNDLPKIEQRMREILGESPRFERQEASWQDAVKRVDEPSQPFKAELLEALRAKGIDTVSFYRCGSFVDVCEGPHVRSAAEIPADSFSLDSIAGAYWKGSEKNPMLTRIYGLAFKTKADLESFEHQRTEALRRDHRKLGAELDLFCIEEEIGKGLPLWLPAGTVLREELEKLAKETEFQRGYQRVATPEIARQELFYRSGHLPYYQADMFPPMVLEERSDCGEVAAKETFYLKPMNCPLHHMIYRTRPRSHRDLPLRFAEYGHTYRYEKSGQLSGLLRVRGMCMNDAHLYVTPEQVKAEFIEVMELHLYYYRLLHLDGWRFRLSLPDGDSSKYIPRPELWHAAEKVCFDAMREMELEFEAVRGEAASYGPKVDVQVRNVVGREETASTNQVDPMAAQEDRFDLTYVGADGQRHRPWVLHRAPLGTHERFIAFLIEHFAGAFPLWLAPVQVRVLPIGDDALEYAHKIEVRLRSQFVRAEVDTTSDTFKKKIRNGTIRKIPVLAVVGRKEAADNTVSVRRYLDQKRQQSMGLDQFIESLLEEIRTRYTARPRL